MDAQILMSLFAHLAPRVLNQVNQQGGLKNFPNLQEAANRDYDLPLIQQNFDALHSLEPNYAADIVDSHIFPDTPEYGFPSKGWKNLDPNDQNLQQLYNTIVDDYDSGIDMENDAATFPAMKSALRMLLQNKNIGR